MANDPKKAAPAKNTAAPKKARITQTARFVVGETSLLISLREGKSGFNVAGQMKTAGSRAQSGSRSTHTSVEAARVEFDKLVADAEKLGWKRRLAGGGSTNAFTEIPAPPAPKTAPAVQ
jgi:hypothetical protein